MEPVTHLAAGLLTAQALRPRLGPARGLTLLCVVSAMIPDMDGITSWFGPELYLLHHRGLTHSLFLLPLLALLLAWAARGLGAALSLRAAFLASCLALAGHLFLDAATAFGTQLFAPFSDLRLSMEGIYIVDPAFTLSLLALGYLARANAPRPPERKAFLALAGLAWMPLYPALGVALRADMQTRYQDLLSRRGVAYDRVTLTPDALAPYYWKVVVETGPDMLVTTANALDIAAPYPALHLKRADRKELRRLGREASIFRTFAWFAAFPFAEPAPAPKGGQATRYADASFLSSGPVLSALFKGKAVFAEFTAVLDEAGRLTAWRDEQGREHPVAPGCCGI
ncbi:MAG: metal-dependent hydrolase [Proteobacteria bacterium]|nr:metal-dependent hydrolase [Pseudomonadota bacterium]MBU1594410.1 metal-dependent hydrolase [Pseudomonadota bacterium]